MSLFARFAIVAACGAVGYLSAKPFVPGDRVGTEPGAAPAGTPALAPLTANLDESALVDEWESLRNSHGGDAADLASLYGVVKDTKDPFRRRAFRAALIAEWSVSNPRAALAYLLEKDAGNAGQLMREWLRRDPQDAVTGILAGGQRARDRLRSLQSEIAKVAPDRLVEVVSTLQKSDNRWDNSTQEAFAIVATKDPAAARAMAEQVNGPLRAQAFQGVARAWAEKDSAAAMAWAEALPAGEVRDNAMKGVLIGWAKVDPMSALSKIDVVPPGGDEMYYASDVGAQVLREAAKKDWDATMRWLQENPGKLGRSSLSGLDGAFSHRLNADPVGTMEALVKSNLPGLENVFGNSVLNDGYVQRDAVWRWLDSQPPNAQTRSLRGSLLNAIAWKEPEAALDFLEKLPNTQEDRELLDRGTLSLLNGGSQLHRVDGLLEKASDKIRPLIIKAALQYGGDDIASDPKLWLERFNSLAPEQRQGAAYGLARGWAASDPEAAIQWALAHEDPAIQQSALSSATSVWAQSDAHQAATWVDKLPAGETRDAAATSLASTIARAEPESAWTWALTVESPRFRQGALTSAYMALRKKDSAIAEQMLQSANLPPEEVKRLQELPNSPPGYLGSY